MMRRGSGKALRSASFARLATWFGAALAVERSDAAIGPLSHTSAQRHGPMPGTRRGPA